MLSAAPATLPIYFGFVHDEQYNLEALGIRRRITSVQPVKKKKPSMSWRKTMHGPLTCRASRYSSDLQRSLDQFRIT